MNGCWLTMLVKRLRTCTGAPSVRSPRSTCRKTPRSTASFMVDAARFIDQLLLVGGDVAADERGLVVEVLPEPIHDLRDVQNERVAFASVANRGEEAPHLIVDLRVDALAGIRLGANRRAALGRA